MVGGVCQGLSRVEWPPGSVATPWRTHAINRTETQRLRGKKYPALTGLSIPPVARIGALYASGGSGPQVTGAHRYRSQLRHRPAALATKIGAAARDPEALPG